MDGNVRNMKREQVPHHHSQNGEYVQIQRQNFYQHLQEFERIRAKCGKLETQVKAFANVSEVVNRQEQQLRLYKKSARQYESAYIASEAKFGHIMKTWISLSKTEGKTPDIDVIEHLLKLKSDDLCSKNFTPSLQDWYSVKPRSNKLETNTTEKENDLEEDCDCSEENVRSNIEGQVLSLAGKCDDDFVTDTLSSVETNDLETDSAPFNDLETDAAPFDSVIDSDGHKKYVSIVSRGIHTCDSSTKEEEKQVTSGSSSEGKVVTFAQLPPTVKQGETNKTKKSDRIVEISAQSHTTSLTDEQTSPSLQELKRQTSSFSGEMYESVFKQNLQLKKIIQEYEEETAEGWKSFVESKQYEDLVKHLRLEIAGVRIHNSELKLLLAAKQGGNEDVLTKKITQLDRQLNKLQKQLSAKHALLHSINIEYEKLKASNQKLKTLIDPSRLSPQDLSLFKEIERTENSYYRSETEGLMQKDIGYEKHKVSVKSDVVDFSVKVNESIESKSETQNTNESRSEGIPVDSYDVSINDWKKKVDTLKTEFAEMVDSNEKDRINMKNVIEKLQNEKEQLEEQCKEYVSLIEEHKKMPLVPQGDEMTNISMTYLREENEKLKVDVATYKHELDNKKRDDAIIEAQINIHQEDFYKEIEARKLDREAHEKEKAHLLGLVSNIEKKYNNCLKQFQEVKSQHQQCEPNRQMLQSQFDAAYSQLLMEQERSNKLDAVLRKQPQISPRPHQLYGCGTSLVGGRPNHPFMGATFATGAPDIATDGPDDESPQPSPVNRQQQQIPDNNLPSFSGSLSSNNSYKQSDNNRRVVPGSDDIRLPLEGVDAKSGKLECPQCYREFKPEEYQKFQDHCKKCMM